MLALLDKRYNYLAANEQYIEAFKLTPEQLIGKTVADDPLKLKDVGKEHT